MKSKVVIYKIVKITSGGNHAWCESDKGLIRKHINSIPDDILRQFKKEE